MVHVELPRYRLHQPPAADRDDGKTSSQDTQLLDGTSQVIPAREGGRERGGREEGEGGRRERGGREEGEGGRVKSSYILVRILIRKAHSQTHILTSCLVFPLVASILFLSSSKLIRPPFLSRVARHISMIWTPSYVYTNKQTNKQTNYGVNIIGSIIIIMHRPHNRSLPLQELVPRSLYWLEGRGCWGHRKRGAGFTRTHKPEGPRLYAHTSVESAL